MTNQPNCIYYFGPFITTEQAKQAQIGYIEDLEQEGAQEITVALKRYKPKELTIFEDEFSEKLDSGRSKSLSRLAKSRSSAR